MLKTIAIFWGLFISLILVITLATLINLQFRCLKKYYPELSFWEYIVLEDKLRITPESQ